MSLSLMFCALAVAGLIIAALPHTSFEIGSGASCIQPLLANRPSQVDELGTKATSRPLLEEAFGSAATAAASFFASTETLAASAGLAEATTPSFRALRQAFSESL